MGTESGLKLCDGVLFFGDSVEGMKITDIKEYDDVTTESNETIDIHRFDNFEARCEFMLNRKAKRRLRELKAEQAKLEQKLNDLILKTSLNEQRDVLIKYHNDLADIYEIKPYSCPICGKYPKSRYYKKDFHVWELYCCNNFGKTHFVSVGKPFRPYCEAVIEWNKHVEEAKKCPR